MATACYDQKIRIWSIVLDSKGCYKNHYKELVLDIMEVNTHKITQGNALELDFMKNPVMSDYVHPNCLSFDKNGRLFVGDSAGLIRVWDISVVNGRIEAKNHFVIKQKEVEEDSINSIIVDPTQQNKLIVHSRDNCVRIIEYSMNRSK